MPSRLRSLVAVTGLLATLAVPAARALEGRELTITVARDAHVRAAYEAIPNDDPVITTVDGSVQPDTCREVTSCVLVPLTVRLPEDRPGEPFLLVVTLDWESRPIEETGAQGNDLDMWIYETRPNSDGSYNQTGEAASQDDPEIIRIDSPTKVDYQIVVSNFFGENDGFELDLRVEGATNVPGAAVATPAPARPARPPASRQPSPEAPASSPPAGPIAAPAVTEPDDIGSFDESLGTFEQDIRARPEVDLLARSRRPVGPPGEVSAATALLWLLALPLALVAGTALLLRRRQSPSGRVRWPSRAR